MALEYRIEKADSFRIVGFKCSTTNEDGAGLKEVPEFWGKVMSSGSYVGIMPLMNQKPFGLLGVNVYNTCPENGKKFDYYIACSTTKKTPQGMSEYTISAYTWAVFPCKRQEASEVMLKIVTDWLPGSGYDLVNTGYESGDMTGGAPDLEVYSQSDDMEIWIALKDK